MKFRSKCLLIIFASLILFWPRSIQAQENFVPISLSQLKINAILGNNGRLKVQENFVFSNRFVADFAWAINAKNISNLQIYRSDTKISKDQYKIRKVDNQILIYDLASPNLGDTWRIEYEQAAEFMPTENQYQLRFQPIKNPGINIDSLEVFLVFPQNVKANQVYLSHYAIHGVGKSGARVKNGAMYYYAKNLSPYSSFTCQVKFNKNLIKMATMVKIMTEIRLAGLDFWLAATIFLPSVIILSLLAMILIRRRSGGPEISDRVSDRPPNQMSPLLVGVLFRQKIGPAEIASQILDLANRGYLVISEKGDGYNIGEKKSFNDAQPFDRALSEELLKGHFKESLAGIEEQPEKVLFSEAVFKIYAKAYDQIAKLGYFVQGPRTILYRYQIFGILLFFLSALAVFISPAFVNPPYIVLVFTGSAIAALFIIALSSKMPMRTKKGRRALSDWLAFRRYLIRYPKQTTAAEAQREEFINYLPYAVVLCCEKEWANHFSRIPFNLPEWYLSYHEIGTLPKFTQRLYPMIEIITQTLMALKEPLI